MTLMAGLLAYVSARSDATAHREAAVAALRTLHHRGPEGSDIEIVRHDVVFGATRLPADGRQPLHYPPDGVHAFRYSIIFDGFLGNADDLREQLRAQHSATFSGDWAAEVVAAAYHHWGPGSVSRLRGAFAFVIWDRTARRAFGARDPFGIKPLYHRSTPTGVWLASEGKALRSIAEASQDAHEIDRASLQHYLTLQYVPEPATMDRDIRRLGAGESFIYLPGGALTERRYSDLTLRPAPVADEPALLARITEALRDSVRAHLSADGSVGALLSSGIDSTAIVALAARERPRLPTFAVGFDVTGYSEVEIAEATARELDVPITSTTVTASDVMRALPQIVWHLDDPVADPALVPLYFLAEAAGRQVDVVLTGDGADELFGGYAIYREPLSLQSVQSLPGTIRRGLAAVARAIPHGVKGRSFLERGTTPIERRYYGNARIFTEAEKAALLRDYDPDIHYTDVTGPIYAEAAGLDDVTTMQHIDLYTWLRGDILVKADRMSMAHSLQLRTPFLDPRVFAVAAGLPARLKVPPRSTATKIALRRAVAELVPAGIVHRKKLGFPTPIRPWLRGELYEWAHSVLDASATGELLDLNLVRDLLGAHRKKDADHSRRIWTVLMFCLWHAMFVAGTLPQPEPPQEVAAPQAPKHAVERR
jgi:asparagine synthase (glutamine-hydrolysing)